VFQSISRNAKIIVYSDAMGFGKTFGERPVQILDRPLEIKSFNNHATPFSLTFETKSGSTYTIEVTHDLKQWGELGEVQGTGSSVKFTDPRLPIVPFERNYFRVKLVE
jgi:hypothetical protein